MTLLEAIEARHSVRRYRAVPIPEDVLDALRSQIVAANEAGHLHIQLVTDEPKAFSGPMSYGKFSGVRNYLVMAGEKGDALDERIGYYGEGLVLLCQQLGLNTCWAGLSYRKVQGTYTLGEDERIACYIAVGYGETQGVQHRSRPLGEISNAGDGTPEWFLKGVQATQLAPTAVNQQKFFIEYLGPSGEGLPKVSIRKGVSFFGYTKMDMGIARLHFEIGAGTENFEWE
jgi:nitroreductase